MFGRKRGNAAADTVSGAPYCTMCGVAVVVDATGRCRLGHRVGQPSQVRNEPVHDEPVHDEPVSDEPVSEEPAPATAVQSPAVSAAAEVSVTPPPPEVADPPSPSLALSPCPDLHSEADGQYADSSTLDEDAEQAPTDARKRLEEVSSWFSDGA